MTKVKQPVAPDPPPKRLQTITVDSDVVRVLLARKALIEFRNGRASSYNEVLRQSLGIDPMENTNAPEKKDGQK